MSVRDDLNLEHAIDQRHFIEAFLAENVRVAAAVEVRSTAVEIVNFRIALR